MSKLDLPQPPDVRGMSNERAIEVLGIWAQQMHEQMQRIVDSFAREFLVRGQPVIVPVAVVGQLTGSNPKYSPIAKGRVVYVDDEMGGATLAFSDGADWLRTSDGVPVT